MAKNKGLLHIIFEYSCGCKRSKPVLWRGSRNYRYCPVHHKRYQWKIRGYVGPAGEFNEVAREEYKASKRDEMSINVTPLAYARLKKIAELRGASIRATIANIIDAAHVQECEAAQSKEPLNQ